MKQMTKTEAILIKVECVKKMVLTKNGSHLSLVGIGLVLF